jgi:hypothetical protein
MKLDPSIEARERALALCLDLGLPMSSLLASLAQLQASLAHEFGRDRAPAIARALAWADAASAAADQAARLLRDGRSRALGEPVASRSLELATVVRSAAALCAGEAAGRARFSVENREPAWLSGNAAQLVQAFARLLLQLVATLPDGPHEVDIRVAANRVEIEARPAPSAGGLASLVRPADCASLALGLQMARRTFAEYGGIVELHARGARVTLAAACEERR